MFLRENVSEFFFYKIIKKMKKKTSLFFFLKFTWLFPSFCIFLSCATPSVWYLCINLFFFGELQHCEKSMILYLHFNSSSSCSVTVYRKKKANKCDCVEARDLLFDSLLTPEVHWHTLSTKWQHCTISTFSLSCSVSR